MGGSQFGWAEFMSFTSNAPAATKDGLAIMVAQNVERKSFSNGTPSFEL
jgi:hypothetical protein